jgi:hypothetical protein
MGCQLIKCGNPTCTVKMKSCQLIGGLCPSCHAKKIREEQNKTNPDGPKQQP